MKSFVKAVLGGSMIAFGAIVYLSVQNHVIGSFLFAFGIFSIYSFGFYLYTGKVCFIPNKKPSYLGVVGITYLGNIAGAVGTGLLVPYTKLSSIQETAQELVRHKLDDSLFSSFLMSVFCGIMICISVMGYLMNKDSLGRYLALFLPIMVFLLSGFEHSIANLFYYTVAGVWGTKAVIYSIVIAVGNLLGGIIIPLAVRYTDQKKMGCE